MGNSSVPPRGVPGRVSRLTSRRFPVLNLGVDLHRLREGLGTGGRDGVRDIQRNLLLDGPQRDSLSRVELRISVTRGRFGVPRSNGGQEGSTRLG